MWRHAKAVLYSRPAGAATRSQHIIICSRARFELVGVHGRARINKHYARLLLLKSRADTLSHARAGVKSV